MKASGEDFDPQEEFYDVLQQEMTQIESLMDMEDDDALFDLLDEMHDRNEEELEDWNEVSLARSTEVDVSAQSYELTDMLDEDYGAIAKANERNQNEEDKKTGLEKKKKREQGHKAREKANAKAKAAHEARKAKEKKELEVGERRENEVQKEHERKEREAFEKRKTQLIEAKENFEKDKEKKMDIPGKASTGDCLASYSGQPPAFEDADLDDDVESGSVSIDTDSSDDSKYSSDHSDYRNNNGAVGTPLAVSLQDDSDSEDSNSAPPTAQNDSRVRMQSSSAGRLSTMRANAQTSHGLSPADEEIATRFRNMLTTGMSIGAVSQQMTTEGVALHIQDSVVANNGEVPRPPGISAPPAGGMASAPGGGKIVGCTMTPKGTTFGVVRKKQDANLGTQFNNAGIVMTPEEVASMRKKRGECFVCGQKCFKKKVFKMIPLNIPGKVQKGKCLVCNPKDKGAAPGTSPIMARFKTGRGRKAPQRTKSGGEFAGDGDEPVPGSRISASSPSTGHDFTMHSARRATLSGPVTGQSLPVLGSRLSTFRPSTGYNFNFRPTRGPPRPGPAREQGLAGSPSLSTPERSPGRDFGLDNFLDSKESADADDDGDAAISGAVVVSEPLIEETEEEEESTPPTEYGEENAKAGGKKVLDEKKSDGDEEIRARKKKKKKEDGDKPELGGFFDNSAGALEAVSQGILAESAAQITQDSVASGLQLDDLFSRHGTPMYGGASRIPMPPQQIAELRKKRGECVSCGQKCVDIKVFKKIPLDIPGKVHNGKCLQCKPSEFQEPARQHATTIRQEDNYMDTSTESSTVIPDEIAIILEAATTEATTKSKLRPETLQFLDTIHGYLVCRGKMDAKHAEVDEFNIIANHPLQVDPEKIRVSANDPFSYKAQYQQQSTQGHSIKSLKELYDAANATVPIYRMTIDDVISKLLAKHGKDHVDFTLKLCDLKSKVRAQEKAKDDYAKRNPKPAFSWLYDIVRGSVEFGSALHVTEFLDILQEERSIEIVKAKNRFKKPSLTGYRDLNIQFQIDTGKGFKHVCEVQIHHKAIKKLDEELRSHDYYQFFRSYFAGATSSLEERLELLKRISSRGAIDDLFLRDMLTTSKDVERLERLGVLFRDQLCEYQWAFCVYARLFEIHKEKHGTKHPSVASTYSGMALVLKEAGKLDEAMVLYKESLTIFKSAFHEQHSTIANTLFNMALILKEQGELSEAMSLFEQSLKIDKKNLGEDNAAVANTYNELATVYRKQSKLEDAMLLFQKSLDIKRDVLGSEDGSISDTLQNIAVVLKNQGKLDESVDLFQQSIDIAIKSMGANHSSVAVGYRKMALVLEKLGKADLALEFYDRSLAIYVKNVGEKHLSVARLYSDMAYTFKAQGDRGQSKRYLLKSVNIKRRVFAERSVESGLRKKLVMMKRMPEQRHLSPLNIEKKQLK
ncbi:unnamed protein product [Cylindrotheca closterium]|uniref:Uncharacterized protein n=1 Tax=Cylindrotheca closterium TaxID=2856 RepID=A0AAD2CLZ7_9STRA|nr:unnamed protein product [Cylindrotheca closterium]